MARRRIAHSTSQGKRRARRNLGVAQALGVLAVLLLASLLAPCTFAEEVRVRFVLADSWAEHELDPPSRAHLRIEPVGGLGGASGEPRVVELEVTPSAGPVVDLTPEVAWRVTVAGAGLWAPERRVLPAPGEGVTVALWPRATLAGRFVVPRGESSPSHLTVHLSTSEGPEGEDPPDGEQKLAAEVACELEPERWSCALPAATLDLRIAASGYAPHFLWGIRIPPEEPLDLGVLSLRRGASIFGWVQGEGGVPPGAGGEVTLRPYLPEKTPGLPRPWEGSSPLHRSAVQEDGFFHLQPVVPGTYVLAAARGQARSRPLYPLVVHEDQTVELDAPVVLRRPATLRVQLDPPVDAAGHPWTTRLQSFAPGEASLVDVETRQATEDGVYETAGLDAGRYLVQIEDASGARFASEEVELEPGGNALAVTLELTRIEGRVTLGEQPLEALLVFGGRTGRRHLHLHSDAAGEFAGVLPRAGEWRVYVEAEEEDVRRTLPAVEVPEPRGGRPARVEIELPDGRVSGEVVDELGRGVGSATVEVVEFATGLPTWDETDQDGEFMLRGLEHGRVGVQASVRQGGRLLESEQVHLRLQSGLEPAPVRLVVREVLTVAGQVLLEDAPATGAVVVGMPRAPGSAVPFAMRRAVTDPAGAFELQVPAYADRVDLLVLATGGVLTALEMTPGDAEALVVPVPRSGGGTLVLEGLTPPGPPSEGVRRPLVFLDGRIPVDENVLRRWARAAGAGEEPGSRLTVPALPPGRHRVCWLTLAEFASLASGAGASLDASECRSGDLPAFGELVMSAPGSG